MVERKARTMARCGSSASPAATAIISMLRVAEDAKQPQLTHIPHAPLGKNPPWVV